MSDVVGTILLLALTVTLFSSIFLFVDSFPQPPPQPSSQFSATLLYNGTHIIGLNIVHLSGPTLASSSIQVFLYSSRHPTAFNAPFTLSSGLNGSTSWNLGQAWSVNLVSYHLNAPDNITISIISSTELLFRVTLPGSNPPLPPQFVTFGTTPTSPAVGRAFSLYVQVSDAYLKNYSVFANVTTVPGSGLATLDQMTYSPSLGEFTLSFPAGASASGTYYVFVNATDTFALRNTVAIPITITTPTSGIPPSGVGIAVSPLPVVNNTAETIYATVQNSGAVTASVAVTFFAGATNLGAASGTIPAGGSTTLSEAWTPTSMGTVALKVYANITGGGNPAGTYNVTVFPRMLFIAHSAPQGVRYQNNTSAYLAEEIRAAGFPFTEIFVACTASLPVQATLNAYDVVVIDYGSSSSGACDATQSSGLSTITGAMAAAPYTSFLIVGADLFASTGCLTYGATFTADFGITGTVGTCTATLAGAATLTYTSVNGQGFRANGIGALKVNATLGGSSSFVPAADFTQGGSNTFLTDGGKTIGTFAHVAQRGRGVVIGTDPALVVTALPAPTSQTWGVGPGGTQIVYNALNYLAKFSSASSTGRAFVDYAVSGAQLVGTSQSHLSSVYVTLRANGPTGGLVAVSLTVNGTIALFGGSAVTSTVYVPPNGANVTVVLTWEAPTVGFYSLGVTATALAGGFYASQGMLPVNAIGAATQFTA